MNADSCYNNLDKYGSDLTRVMGMDVVRNIQDIF